MGCMVYSKTTGLSLMLTSIYRVEQDVFSSAILYEMFKC